ncbi:MAG: Ldh family oxidoreductase [Deltaproteobacteria bacterium]|nr:Ldh family oxidoreductase [Deltaproteobacteria bacterium]
MSTKHYDADALTTFASALLVAKGMHISRADVVAHILLEGDLLGHTTHGLQLLGPYLKSIESEAMKLEGEPEVLSARPVTELWDGKYLVGPWLVDQAFKTAAAMARKFGTGTVVIRRCSHIGCLAAYMLPITEQNLLGMLICSDPANSTVAPHCGTTPVYSPNPIAAGIPTDGDPVILDISMSTTTNGLCMRSKKAGKKLPHPWVKDHKGMASDDPGLIFDDPPGSILPLGGIDSGHKGFALGLLVEALTSGLGGHGRADGTDDWGASVFVQVQDTEGFCGADAFKREFSWLADACRQSKPVSQDAPVRVPGEAGLARRRQSLTNGVQLFPGIMESLSNWAGKLGVTPPSPID